MLVRPHPMSGSAMPVDAHGYFRAVRALPARSEPVRTIDFHQRISVSLWFLPSLFAAVAGGGGQSRHLARQQGGRVGERAS